MIDDNVAVELTAEDLQGAEFSDAQKLKIQELVRERLGRFAKSAEADKTTALELQRAEFKRHLPVERTTTTMQDFMDTQERKRASEDRERVELGKLFGPGSNGMQAQSLKKSDPSLYSQMRDRAIQLGLVAGDVRPAPGGTVKNAFEKGALIHRFGEKL